METACCLLDPRASVLFPGISGLRSSPASSGGLFQDFLFPGAHKIEEGRQEERQNGCDTRSGSASYLLVAFPFLSHTRMCLHVQCIICSQS